MRPTLSLTCLCLLGLSSSAAPATATEVDLQRLQDEAVATLQQYVRIDTVNPPGNESRGIAFIANVLKQEGIAFETAESAPGRGNLWARLDATAPDPARAIVLLHHVDVVPADRRYWKTDPFGGEIRDGCMYGRGTLDTKGLGIAELQSFVALHRAGVPLRRSVILVAVSDEEAGGAAGAGWLLEKHPEVFADTEWVINEGGLGLESNGHAAVNVEVTQKIPLWIRLTSRDQPGHASVPRAESSVTRLVHALERISRDEFDPRVVPAVDRYAKARAAAGLTGEPAKLADLSTALRDPEFRRRLQQTDSSFAALTHDTCAITRLGGSGKINVVPPEAWAEIDCRLLPDRDPDQFLARLTALIADPAVEIHELMRFRPGDSTIDTGLYRAIVEVNASSLPDAVVIASVASGFTDSHYFRDRGIIAYGYGPFMVPQSDLPGIHGNDERIRIDELRHGTVRLLEILRRVVY